MKFNCPFFILFFLSGFLFGQPKSFPLYKDEMQEAWVNKWYESLTMEEKIGQLFVVAAYTNKDSLHENEIKKLIVEEKIGGLIFMQDDAERQVKLTNQFQQMSKVPLLISIDAEWGVSMRLKNTSKFPWAMTIGATKNSEKLAFKVGKKIAEHCKRLGVHVNFAPVVDINTNANNPIIGNRSFGSNKENVSQKATEYMKGMLERNVLGSAKHFPGHGDTDQDSHKTLPTVNQNLTRLEEIELYPFKKLIEAGVGMIMVAHLNVPAIETDANLPSSLSKKVVTDLLKNTLGFKGLIATDALNMQGVTKNFAAGEIDLKAFEAGNDVLLFSQEVRLGKQKIMEAIAKDSLLEKRLEESVKKILRAKYFVGLNDLQPIREENILPDLNDAESFALTHEIVENAITVIKNKNEILPLKNITNKKFAFVSFEDGENETFFTYLNKYATFDKVGIKQTADINKLKGYDFVVIGIHKNTDSPYKNYASSERTKNLVDEIARNSPSILCLFTSPYGLKSLETSNVKSVLVGYQNIAESQQIIPQIIFGAIPAKGILPVDVNNSYKLGLSIKTNSIGKLRYTLPENVRVKDSHVLKKK